MDCSRLNRRHCRETFNLYYYQSERDEATPTHPAWMENPYVKVATVAADHLSGFDKRSNIKLLRLEQLRKAGLYLAFQSQGACMALLSVRLFYRKCPPLRRAFASFPETVPHSLVEQVSLTGRTSHMTGSYKIKSHRVKRKVLLQARGVCVEHAATLPGEQSQPPSMLCGEDGQWVGQPTSSCACRPGYEPQDADVGCGGEVLQ